MNRRQLLKTLAVLPVTPVEKLLEPVKRPLDKLVLDCSLLTAGEVRGMSSTVIIFDEPEDCDYPLDWKQAALSALRHKYGDQLKDLIPKEPPCTPS